MKIGGMQHNELKALVSLLEDDQLVDHVQEKLLTVGKDAIPYLEQEWESNLNPQLQQKIEGLIHTLQYQEVSARLKAWYQNPDRDLLHGLWIVATYRYPDLEFQKLKKEIESIYTETWLEFQPNLSAFDQVKVINSVLFGKLKFGANNKNFHEPSNSFLNVVLETKKGNPISLCVIYLLVAKKLKMPVHGVNLPNLFLLTYKDNQHQFYINVFNKGLIFTKQDIENYIHELHLTAKPSYFEPCTADDIVRRTLRNLVHAFDKKGEHDKAEEVKELLLLISDGADLEV